MVVLLMFQKTAWQTASFYLQEGPAFGNLTLRSLIPGKMRQISMNKELQTFHLGQLSLIFPF